MIYIVVVMSAHGDRKLMFVAPTYFTTATSAEAWITSQKANKDRVYIVQTLTEAA